jgi:SAM-dependent methyltransferase
LRDRLFQVGGTWNLEKCPKPECGLVWLNPMPVEEDTGQLYRTYYTHTDTHPENGEDERTAGLHAAGQQAYRLLLRATSLSLERKRLHSMYLDKVTCGTLLEVGCGDGSRLAGIRELGWVVEGQEVDARAANQARRRYGLKVHLGRLRALAFPEAAFDAVVMNHVIEHVHDPVQLLAECHRILKPGGELVMVTPNTESLGHRRFGSCWQGLDPPRHLHLFAGRTLETVVSRAGFRKWKQWSTAANAQAFAIASLDIRRYGRHLLDERPRIWAQVQAMVFQLWARLVYTRDPNSGEECVLRARR